jgi:PIN domain nuclease of toxin-antitoxin system
MQLNLLDTHTFIWFINGDKELSTKARAIVEAEDALNFVSIASLWEIAIKISLGKLELKTPFNQLIKQLEENGFEILPITFDDTLILSTLPFHHRDPFDRMIIAQGLAHKMTIISKDPSFNQYNATTIW